MSLPPSPPIISFDDLQANAGLHLQNTPKTSDKTRMLDLPVESPLFSSLLFE
jgi:hypothetical protein